MEFPHRADRVVGHREDTVEGSDWHKAVAHHRAVVTVVAAERAVLRVLPEDFADCFRSLFVSLLSHGKPHYSAW